MKQKILSLALSSLATLGVLFGASACGRIEMGGNNTEIEPGTVITDETVLDELLEGLTPAELSGLSFSASVNMKLTEGEKTQEQSASLEGEARLGKSPAADIFARISAEEEASQYLLGFVRGENFYSTMGEQEKADFNALKKALKGEEPTLLERQELNGMAAVVTSPAAFKLLANTGSLLGGVVTKTEGGYTLGYDLFRGADSLLAGAETLLENVEANVGMTVTALFANPFVKNTLTTLLDGITAKELYDIVKALPGEIVSFLPEAGTGSAQEYVEGLLRSGEFFGNVTGGDDAWKEFQTFGEIPLDQLFKLISGGEEELGDLGLKDMVSTFRGTLKKELVSLLLPLFGREGEITRENAALTVEFSFDDAKRLVGFTADALAEGDITAAGEEEEQPDGGKTPEEGEGDPVTTAVEATPRLRVTLKLSAACKKTPELFDLTGCKYRTDDGEQTIK